VRERERFEETSLTCEAPTKKGGGGVERKGGGGVEVGQKEVE